MRVVFHVLIAISCLIGGLALLLAGFSGAMSAVQQAAIAAMVSAWVIIFHVVSSMLDRRFIAEG
ncbi:hypothetical protein [Sphingomonas sp. SRS2]|uniref:hypothetical protein n=1 Tax=Sphingomonas sp. SRS2 TaxID=133190 RepID=UPI0006184AA6|nr:hypothetical protein [Sphingomonas sp. SRS2]KKC24852.1 hypothetical protein WP12_16575 [Sphingomonas sp. SRS2]